MCVCVCVCVCVCASLRIKIKASAKFCTYIILFGILVELNRLGCGFVFQRLTEQNTKND